MKMSNYAAFCAVLVSLQYIELVLSSALHSRDRAPADGCCVHCSEEEAYFGYDPTTCHAPRFWSRITPAWRFCGGVHQSPINIRTATSRFHSKMRPELINLGTRLPAKTRNNGHSPKFETDYNVIGLRGVPFSHQDLYFFKELHPHIGNTFQSGSEHSVDGNFKPMEIHMVFWNSNYRDIVHAKSKPRGLAVIGVNVEVGDPADDIYVEEQEKYNPLPPQHIYNKCTCTNDFFYGHVCRQLGLCRCSSDKDCPFGGKCRSLGRVPYCGEMRYLQVPEGVTPEDALPYDGGFYTYRGSLTTPPCFETVQWIMMRCPIKVSRAAYHALAMMRDVRGNFLSRDGVKRPIQRGLPGFPPIQVYRNFLWETTGKEVPFYDVSEIQKNNVY